MNILQSIFTEALAEGGELHDCGFAARLYNLLDNYGFGKVDFIESDILTLLYLDKVENLPDPGIDDNIQDLRFSHLDISGVRKFPASVTIGSETFKSFFAIDFVKNDNPKDIKYINKIILGENGIGKSSMFGSLEMLTMRRMFTAEIHNIKSDNYLKNISAPPEKVNASLVTASSTFSYPEKDPAPTCVPAFFISEWDIRKLENYDNIGDYICIQLGISPITDFIYNLSNISQRLDRQYSTFSTDSLRENAISIRISCLRFYINMLTSSDPDTIYKNIQDIITCEFPDIPYLINVYDRLVKNPVKIIRNFNRSIRIYTNFIKRLEGQDEFKRKYSEFTEIFKQISKYVQHISGDASVENLFFLKEELSKAADLRIYLVDKICQFIDVLKSVYKPDKRDIKQLIAQLLTEQSKLDDITSSLSSNIFSSYRQDPDKFKFMSKDLSRVIGCLKKIFNIRMENWIYDYIRPVLINLMQQYLYDENIEIDVKYDPTSMSVELRLYVNQDGQRAATTPREYFNTFRFKMFGVVLNIACACCAKMIYRQNFPFVIDDVFDASDFGNRSRMDEFIMSVVDCYNDVIDYKKYPFQLIFFTQDDLIGQTIFNGLKEKKMPVSLSRMHDYRAFPYSEYKKDKEENTESLYLNIAEEIDYAC